MIVCGIGIGGLVGSLDGIALWGRVIGKKTIKDVIALRGKEERGKNDMHFQGVADGES